MDRTAKINLLVSNVGVLSIWNALVDNYYDNLDFSQLELPQSYSSLEWVRRQLAPPEWTIAETHVDGDPALSLARPIVRDSCWAAFVGITGTGKSTLMNALMGRQFLPAGIGATTVVAVYCRRGIGQSLTVHYREPAPPQPNPPAVYVDQNVTGSLAESLLSTIGNKNNYRNISDAEWVSEATHFPAGKIILADLPGFGADSLAESDETALRSLFTDFKIVVYILSVRQCISSQDAAVLKVLVERKTTIIFVITKRDAETESEHVGDMTSMPWHQSKEEKIESQINQIKVRWREIIDEVKPNSGSDLSDPLVLEVSANEFFNKGKGHNIEKLANLLSAIAEQTAKQRFQEDVQELITGLHAFGLVRELPNQLNVPSSGKNITNQKTMKDSLDELLINLTKETKKIQSDLSGLDREYSVENLKKLLPQSGESRHISDSALRCKAKISAAFDRVEVELDDFYHKAVLGMQRCGLRVNGNKFVDNAVDAYRDFLEHVDTVKNNSGMQKLFKYIAGIFGHENDVPDYEMIDEKFYESLRELLKRRIAQLEKKRALINSQTVDDVTRISARLASARTDSTRATAGPARRPAQLSTRSVLPALERLAKDAAEATTKATDEVKKLSVQMQSARPGHSRNDGSVLTAAGLLHLLGRSYLEASFQQHFAKAVQQARSPSKGPTSIPRVLLLSPRREHCLRLVSLLRHQLDRYMQAQGYWAGLTAGDWPASYLRVGCVPSKIPLPNPATHLGGPGEDEGTVLEDMTVVIAPEDQLQKNKRHCSDWLQWADVIGIYLDAPRLSAGLRTLREAKYFEFLLKENIAEKILYLCSDGALVDRWGKVLKEEVRPNLKSTLDDIDGGNRRILFSDRPWFVFEDYNVVSLDG
jgi:GTPase Era involved in 16S rRNA processing